MRQAPGVVLQRLLLTDFIVSAMGPIYLETTLPGLTKASLYPKVSEGAGHRLRRFPARPDCIGQGKLAKVVLRRLTALGAARRFH